MDLVDKRIIAALSSNCRTSYRNLSRQLGIASTSVQRRVAKLKDIGLLSRPYVILSLAMLDAEYCYGDASEKDDDIIPQFGANPSVIDVARLSPRRLYAGAEVTGSVGLYELGRYFREFSCVQDVDIQFIHPVTPTPLEPHQKYVYLGKRVTLTKHHQEVLKHLIHDARMSATDIAKQTTYSSRRVQQIIQDLQTNGGFYFISLLKFSAAGYVPFWLNIYFDEKKIKPHEVVGKVYERIPLEYWNAFQFSNQPRIMHFCTTNDIQTMVKITNSMKDEPFAERVESYVIQPQNHFVGPGYIRLSEMLGLQVSNHIAEYNTSQ
ncbi:MAG: Lrp/AsnC family transcriptional regulator [Candidatus Thorarchaeota archaeon]